jgi:hypothetical protein
MFELLRCAKISAPPNDTATNPLPDLAILPQRADEVMLECPHSRLN